MEHLVIELNNLNFQQTKSSEYAKKDDPPLRDKGNRLNHQPPPLQRRPLKAMTDEPSTEPAAAAAKFSDTVSDCEEHDFSSASSTASLEENSFDASEEESEIDGFGANKSNNQRSSSRGGVNLRKLPKRSVRTQIFGSKSLRISMKPPKTSPRTTEKLRPAEIKKLYTNKKLTNFRPTSLETIFEEPQPVRGDTEQFRLVGAKKLRRALVCSDGINANKAVVNRRRARIKSKLGRRATWKKIPLQNFLNYMQSTNMKSENEDDGTTSCSKDVLNTKKTSPTPLKTVNDESDDFEMDLPVEKS